MYHNICICCHQQNTGDWEIRKMQDIITIMKRFQNADVPKRYLHDLQANRGLLFHTNFHCDFGMECDKLQKKKEDVEQLARQAEDMILSFAVSADTKSIREVLHLCQGCFPLAYRFINRISSM